VAANEEVENKFTVDFQTSPDREAGAEYIVKSILHKSTT